MVSGIGELLQDMRIKQDRSLLDAARELEVPPATLAALEGEEFATLGEEASDRVHLRCYAEYLGLDPDPLLERYAQHRREATPTSDQSAPVRRWRPSSFDALAIVLGLAAAVLVVLTLA